MLAILQALVPVPFIPLCNWNRTTISWQFWLTLSPILSVQVVAPWGQGGVAGRSSPSAGMGMNAVGI